jgi:hypothetical protein
VGKIEPGHIHAGRQQPGQDVAIAGRAQSADDLGPSLVTQHGGVTSWFFEKRALILSGNKIHTLWEKSHIFPYNIARNYNSKKTGWARVDKLLYDISLLAIKL